MYVSGLIPYEPLQKKSHLPSPRLEHPLRGWHLGSHRSFSTTRIITVVSLILLHDAYATIRKRRVRYICASAGVLSNGRKYRVGCPHFLFSSKQIDCSKVIRQQSCHWFEWENLKRSFSLKTDSALPIANEADVISIWNLIIVPLIPLPFLIRYSPYFQDLQLPCRSTCKPNIFP